jgi:hypothetical protein
MEESTRHVANDTFEEWHLAVFVWTQVGNGQAS